MPDSGCIADRLPGGSHGKVKEHLAAAQRTAPSVS